jgi:hypothetical protein
LELLAMLGKQLCLRRSIAIARVVAAEGLGQRDRLVGAAALGARMIVKLPGDAPRFPRQMIKMSLVVFNPGFKLKI